MEIKPFLVERFLNAYEQNAEINIAETGIEPFTLSELLTIIGEENFFDELKKIKLTYGFIEGSSELRREIANLYEKMPPENILVAGGAIGANFLVFYSLVEPGDTVISVFPSYQQLYSVAESFGANVKLLRLREENSWLPDINELIEMIDDKTKLIVINNPHNPTGSLIDVKLLKEICAITEENNAYLLCDEAYRGLYIKPDDAVPSAADISERAIVTGSFSKVFSLAGLRLGWIATHNREVIEELKIHRDYTTISNSIIDDALATLALKNMQKILERNLKILQTNHKILSNWIENEPLIDWIPPKAGSIAFPQYSLELPSEEFCIRLLREKGALLVPGSCFGLEGYFRIGYGCKTETLIEGLSRLKDFLNNYR
ncbi:aminotransferase [Candidatus Bathyarchaeota archaeon]|nr:MAG: aminotransferase [Candidatus Bathyarchaeota archaeon]